MQVSFRDPAGQVFVLPDHVIRVINAQGRKNFEALLNSQKARTFVQQQRLIDSQRLSSEEAQSFAREYRLENRISSDALVVNHERISFPSFPYEWSPLMLAAAGELTMELSAELLSDGLGVKDATPYNVLFRGSEAVFIDILSIEQRRPTDPVWVPYAQAMRTFVLPLMANRFFGIPISQIFLSNRDGLEPEALYRMASSLRLFSPAFLTHVSIPKWLSKKAEAAQSSLYEERTESAEKTDFILRALFSRLSKAIRNAAEPPRSSAWSEYATSTHTYSIAELEQKEQFVRKFLQDFQPKQVLDVGCNTGVYSMIAADCGADVVAIDSDPAVIDVLWKQAQAQRKKILPLVIDLSRPSPAMGWRNRECPSFLQRAQKSFDAVLMLAVIHHLMVSERVPLEEVLSVIAEVTRRFLLIEYVSVQDPMFQRLTRGRAHLHVHETEERFRKVCGRHFTLVCREEISKTRVLYLWERPS